MFRLMKSILRNTQDGRSYKRKSKACPEMRHGIFQVTGYAIKYDVKENKPHKINKNVCCATKFSHNEYPFIN